MPSVLALLGGRRGHGRGGWAALAHPARGIVIREPVPVGTEVAPTLPATPVPAPVVKAPVPVQAVESAHAARAEEAVVAASPEGMGTGSTGTPRGATRARAMVVSDDEDEGESLQKRPRRPRLQVRGHLLPAPRGVPVLLFRPHHWWPLKVCLCRTLSETPRTGPGKSFCRVSILSYTFFLSE